jgi:miniconductance mechanosensitive channel
MTFPNIELSKPDFFSLAVKLESWLETCNLNSTSVMIFRTLIILAVIVSVATLANFITHKIILTVIRKLVARSKNTWDDIFLERKVFDKLSHFAPALVVYFTVGIALADFDTAFVGTVRILIEAYMIFITLMVIDSLLNALHEIYLGLPVAKTRPIKGYIQTLKIILFFIGGILILSIILKKNPVYFLTGLSAMAAVLLLVFKDTILGFTASIQLSANNMLKPGDSILMPSRGADGIVLEISLNTVKVQNWDKTITTIPTYALISESFTNFVGIEQAEGRRIKRSLFIDLTSIRFASEEMIEKFARIQLLAGYIQEKQAEIESWNIENQIDTTVSVNGRRITNLGTFRRYIEEYLRFHPKIKDDMALVVRQLQPTAEGLPIEILTFCSEKEIPVYEAIQSDIFDHLLAVLPEFGLRVFQNPGSNDFRKLTDKTVNPQDC